MILCNRATAHRGRTGRTPLSQFPAANVDSRNRSGLKPPNATGPARGTFTCQPAHQGLGEVRHLKVLMCVPAPQPLGAVRHPGGDGAEQAGGRNPCRACPQKKNKLPPFFS